MERLTEQVGNCIEVKGNKSLYSCEERKRAYLQNAIIRLCKYEDTGLTPEEIERILDEYGRGMTLRTSNAERLRIIKDVPTEELRKCVEKWRGTHEADDPLTLDELREMNGEPVWAEHYNGEEWITVHWDNSGEITTAYKACLRASDYGRNWLAYRRKPEGAEEKSTIDTPAKNL